MVLLNLTDGLPMPSVTHPLPCIVYFLYANFDECAKALINFSIAMHGSAILVRS